MNVNMITAGVSTHAQTKDQAIHVRAIPDSLFRRTDIAAFLTVSNHV